MDESTQALLAELIFPVDAGYGNSNGYGHDGEPECLYCEKEQEYVEVEPAHHDVIGRLIGGKWEHRWPHTDDCPITRARKLLEGAT